MKAMLVVMLVVVVRVVSEKLRVVVVTSGWRLIMLRI
jgi:hypothetical protein